VGRGVELRLSFVQTLVQNTEQRFRVKEFNFEVHHSRRYNLTELRRTGGVETPVITVRITKEWYC
jgi:hypothetical protein